MIKEALQYLVGLRRRDPYTLIGDDVYVLNDDGTMNCSLEDFTEYEKKRREADNLFVFPEVRTSTLSSIVDYITKDPEDFFKVRGATPIIHITSPREVVLYAQLDKFGRRMPVIISKAVTPNIQFDKQMDIETFIILLNSCFARTDDRDTLLKLVSRVSIGTTQASSDDGITQSLEVKQGVATVGVERAPNPVLLAPFRTFAEVDQPQSYYVFRIHEGARPALYQAGGAEWEIMAIDILREYFTNELDGMNVHIIG